MDDSDNPVLVSSHRCHKAPVTALRFRPYMKHLVSASSDGSLFLWSLHYRRRRFSSCTVAVQPYKFLGHQDAICSIAVSPLDTVVASASKDRTVRLWLPSVEGHSTVLRGHSGAVRSVEFSPDGRRLLTASDDKTIKAWDVVTEKFVFCLLGHINWVRSAEFSRDGRLVVSGSDDKTVRLWDVESRDCIHQFDDILGMVKCVRFHPNGTCIGSCGTDECLQIWDMRSKRLVQHYPANVGIVNSICFHPSGNFVLSTCDDGNLRVWDLREGQLLYTIEGHEGATLCAEYSSSGDFFASGSTDNYVMLRRSNLNRFRGYSSAVLSRPLSVDSHAGDENNYDEYIKFQTNDLPKRIPVDRPSKGRPCSYPKEKTISNQKNDIDVDGQSIRKERLREALDLETNHESENNSQDTPSTTILQHIVTQLDMLARIVNSIEERVSHAESEVSRLAGH